jgi:hypothetical protein
MLEMIAAGQAEALEAAWMQALEEKLALAGLVKVLEALVQADKLDLAETLGWGVCVACALAAEKATRRWMGLEPPGVAGPTYSRISAWISGLIRSREQWAMWLAAGLGGIILIDVLYARIVAAPLGAFLVGADPTDPQRQQARADARSLIDEADKALRGGQDFTEVVKKHSKGANAASGGIWPPMAEGSFKETKVEAAAFALREGQFSDIIETDTGFYIVKALKVTPGTVVSFEDAQEEIERLLSAEQHDKLQEQYLMSKAEGATISPSRNLEQLAADKAVDRYWRKGSVPR